MMTAALVWLACSSSSGMPQDRAITLWDADRRLPAVFEPSADAAPEEIDSIGPEIQDRDRDRDRSDEPRQHNRIAFAIGPIGGYLKARGADRGTWFAGIQARLYFFRFLAAEANVTFHQNRYEDGDITVTQYPVQVSGLFFPFPSWSFQPYVVGGVGWYYTRIDYSDDLNFIESDTTHWFGGHVGAGVELAASRAVSLHADFRWVFIDPESDIESRDGDADYWQITFGLGFGF